MRTTLRALHGVLVLLLLTFSAEANSGNTTMFKADGDYVQISIVEGSIGCSAYAGRFKTDGNLETFLEYSCFDYASNLLVLHGHGLIPNGDLKFTGKEAMLQTDTASNAGFWHDFGTGGTVAISFRKNGVQTVRSTGTYEVTRGGSSYRTRGSWAYEDATASGMLPGIAFVQSAYAAIGFNKAVEIVFLKP